MGRIAKIILYALLILALWFWFSSIFKSCGSDDKNSAAAMTEIEGEFADLTESDVNDEFFADSDAGAETNTDDFMVEESSTDTGTEDGVVEEIDYSSIDEDLDDTSVNSSSGSTSKPISSSSSTSSTSSNTPTYSTSNNSATGRYLVISGSYLVEDNAEAMSRKLSKMGYAAEVIKFDLSEFHSVCAGRYNDYDAALNATAKLKQQGIDSYVHRRKI